MPLPSQLTVEEKSLKKKYAKLREKKRLLKLQEKTAAQPVQNSPKKEVVNPKDAKEAAKRLVESGGIVIKKVVQRSHGFKRSKSLQEPITKEGDTSVDIALTKLILSNGMPQNRTEWFLDYFYSDPTPPSPKKPMYSTNNSDQTTFNVPFKSRTYVEADESTKTVKSKITKDYYSRFIKSSDQQSPQANKIPKINDSSITSVRIDEDSEPIAHFSKKECSIFISGDGITEELVRKSFVKFGPIQMATVDTIKGTGFVTYENPRTANVAKREMDKSRIAGIDITVEKASIENGYVELTPEAEQNSWAMIAAGRNLTKQVSSKRSKQSLVQYNMDF